VKKYLFLIFLCIPVLFAGCAVKSIDDGQAGVKADFGKIQDQPLRSGWHWYSPFFSWLEIWDLKTLEMKETANVPSSEGLISTLDVSVIYNVPKENVVRVRKTIGRDYRSKILEPYIRESIRNVASGYEVKALFNEKGRVEIGQKMLAFLKDKIEPRGIVIQDVLLRDVQLPRTFSVSIETKLKSEQEALQKEFELQKAKKDAEIEVARAQGVAQSNQIISGSLDENYLRYLWVQALQSASREVIYVPTEGNIPIMEASRFAPAKAGANK
jgi:regulator of protease activity HflC (stomatin/prohibitin superfamily)